MTSNDQSDRHLRNLGQEDGPPPPKPNNGQTKSKSRPTRQINKGRTPRISARRIGGPNLRQDFEAYRAAKMKNNSNVGNSSDVQNSSLSRMQPVPMSMGGRSTTRPKSSKGLSGTMPRVQELGGLATTGRRSSSRLAVGTYPKTIRSRTSSGTSNHSGMIGDNTQAVLNREMIIRYGELLKKSVVTTQWKKRFFILTEKSLLYYLEPFDVPQELHQIDIEPKGHILLNLIEDVRKDKSADGTFQIFTPARTYRLRMEGDDEESRYAVSAWVASLKGAYENTKQQHQSTNHFHRGSFSNYKVDEVDEAMLSSNQYKHPAKRLIDAEVFSPKQNEPHKPAALDEFEDWTPFDVAAWLYTVHLQEYSEQFYQKKVDGKLLKTLGAEQDATELGVKDEDVERFLEAVQALKDMNVVTDRPVSGI